MRKRRRVAALQNCFAVGGLAVTLQPVPASAPKFIPPRPPWWLWPHLLSLDAPLVALTWQGWWAKTAHLNLPWSDPLILGLAVWMIYLADRLADVTQSTAGELNTDRHAFFARHTGSLRWLLGVVVASLTILTPTLLPFRQFMGGLALLGLAGVYFWSVHTGPRRTRYGLPKEALVGGMFAVGSAFFVLGAAPVIPGSIVLGVALLGVVCFLNCALISAWEQSPRDRRDPTSLLNAWPRLTARLGTITLLLLTGTVILTFTWRTGGASLKPFVLSLLGLWALDQRKAKLSARSLRVLADAVLFTPLLFF